MSKNIIEVEDVSKLYRLGLIGTGTLSHDINRWWAKMRGKEDPFLKIGSSNVRDQAQSSDYVWSLKDINFAAKEGVPLAIIGRNGAGKSTLLKLLSRITAPTTGQIRVKGRIASLLEVGTGFHPELTGRENVFLNGAIMGMTKPEIASKLDEIVEFSGCSAYIDTPVKRYSSGMTVRLGFAVAAHLEPEILVVDEVLAVGDAEFQRKCIGKMKDVSTQGRTVLFVSHNMTAVNSLCDEAIYLRNGQMVNMGATEDIVNEYLTSENTSTTEQIWAEGERPGDDVVKLMSARLVDEHLQKVDYVKMHEPFAVEFTYEMLKSGYAPHPNFHIMTGKGELAFIGIEPRTERQAKTGVHTVRAWIPANLLNDSLFTVRIAVDNYNPFMVHAEAKDALMFEVVEDTNFRPHDFKRKIRGVMRPDLDWKSELIG